jgi:hypothetical protein
VDADIKLYVRAYLAEDERLKRWPNEVKRDIEVKFGGGARGLQNVAAH